ncbi:hypothetical protein BJV82DRAFT_616174 [Fennellomyces sp. T-0311]|nr:hypothetical protein BJV82DRAFT_616174 [Fennellomyces sp. T-0311]
MLENTDTKVSDIDPDRSSPGYAYGSVLFIFDGESALGVTYDEAREALSEHVFTFLGANNNPVTETVDSIRLKSQNDVCRNGLPLKIEAHIKRIDSPSSLQSFIKYYISKQPINNRSERTSITFKKTNQPISAEIVTTIPPRPVYHIYTVNNIPLGDPRLIKNSIESAIRDVLPYPRHKAPGFNTHTMNNKKDIALVEIILVYQTDLYGQKRMPCGDAMVIIDTTQEELNWPIQFHLAGQKYQLDYPTEYYLYCTKCKVFNSHEIDDFNCQRSMNRGIFFSGASVRPF